MLALLWSAFENPSKSLEGLSTSQFPDLESQLELTAFTFQLPRASCFGFLSSEQSSWVGNWQNHSSLDSFPNDH